MPCLNCSKLLWQSNVREWYIPKSCVNFENVPVSVKNYSEEEEQVLQLLLRSGLKISYVDFDMDKFVQFAQDNKKYFSYLG